MSAKDHDHDHDHDHHGHDHAHDEAPQAPLPPTPEHGYWKSLAELAGQSDWQQNPSNKEFPPGADQPPVDPMSRRNFFHLMGASMGLAGLTTACRYEKEEIVPLARRPEDQTPGTTLQYATAFDLGGAGHSLIATSFEGRPIHIDGNPEHPFAGGAIVGGTKRHGGAHTFAQAALLHLYDPDRSRDVMQNGKGSSMEVFRVALADLKKLLGTGGLHVLAEASSSPTLAKLKRDLASQNVVWREYEPISWDNERVGTRFAFGRPVRPIAKLDKCETIVTIDCDIFVEHPAAMRYSRDWARSRQRHGGTLGPDKINRLWSVESVFSNTGAVADHRLPLRSEHCLPFVMLLDGLVTGGTAQPNLTIYGESKIKKFVDTLAAELRRNTGKAVVIAGRRQPPEVHAIVARINQAISAPGNTLDYHEDPEPDRPTHLQAITALAKDIQAKRVQALVMLGGNPIYDAPADLDFGGLLKTVPTSIHLSEYNDETSRQSTWHIPKAHFLEAWGDARTWDGTITVAQPLIAPLYGGLSSIELASLLLGQEMTGQQAMEDAYKNSFGLPSWKKYVHDGFVEKTQFQVATGLAMQPLPQITLTPSQQGGSKPSPAQGNLEVVFHFSSFTYDGRYANNPWLWETPDFLTKVTWDNYALVSPETARVLNVQNDQMITVNVNERSIELPCYVMPGQARYSIGLVLGGGRTDAGRVGGREGKRSVGWNTYKVRTSTGFDFATGAKVNGGGGYTLANVQDHWNYRPGLRKDIGNEEIAHRSQELIREASIDNVVKGYKAEHEGEFWDDEKEAEAKHKKARHLSLFEEHDYKGHRWAMAIDLSTCHGCNACMVACQSENNVPVVGRNEVMNNREMHWIRIDRYFQGSPEDPHVVHQPLACQQCENAPCEQVCPVGATSHSDEGLNDMAYNRCIGTRYCANNCPYRVRRFNFLDWNKEFRDARNKVRRLLFNPDVTVRMRGVMEKCTFCVQRIQNGKIKAKAQIRAGQRGGEINGPLPDGEIETACQMACPTEAIVFGDLADPNSRVSKLHSDPRSYALLPETYTKPRNRYLARVRNPNTDMPGEPTGGEGGHQ